MPLRGSRLACIPQQKGVACRRVDHKCYRRSRAPSIEGGGYLRGWGNGGGSVNTRHGTIYIYIDIYIYIHTHTISFLCGTTSNCYMLLASLWSFVINPDAPSCLEMWNRFKFLGTPWRRCRAKTNVSRVPAGAWYSRGGKVTWKGAWNICRIM